MAKIQEISVREFRQNLSLYLHAAKMKKQFVVMRHLEPIAQFGPPEKKKKTQKQLREELLRDIQEAREQHARGEWYTTNEVRQHMGLPPLSSNGRQKRTRK